MIYFNDYVFWISVLCKISISKYPYVTTFLKKVFVLPFIFLQRNVFCKEPPRFKVVL